MEQLLANQVREFREFIASVFGVEQSCNVTFQSDHFGVCVCVERINTGENVSG